MKDSKLLGILAKLDLKELAAFAKFVNSPYFNKSEKVICLFEYLKKQAIDQFPEELVEREVVFQKIFPGENYDGKCLNHLMNQLFKLLERFLSIEGFEKDGILSDYYLLNEFVDRKLEKQYQFAFTRAQRKLEAQPFREEHFYFQRHLLFEVADQNFQSKDKRQYDNNLEQASQTLDEFYFAKKLKFLVAKAGWEKIISRPFNKPLIENIKSIVEQNEYLNLPQIKIYHKLLQMLSEDINDDHFFQLKRILNQSAHNFSSQEQRNLYSFMSNFCAEKIRLGKEEYVAEVMEIYLKGLEDGFFLDNGMVSPWIFKNLVTLGLGLKKFQWTEDFILEYSSKLPVKQQKDAHYFSLAELHYSQEDYLQTINYLSQVEFVDVHYSLGAKELLLKTYYTTGETEALLSLIFSFRIYLKRNKLITKNIRQAYENFIRFVAQIHKNGEKKNRELEEKIKKTGSVVARKWLLRQLQSLR